MSKYIPGHTGKKIILTKNQAFYIAKHNRFGKKMRVYSCTAEIGMIHWHLTRMSKDRFYKNHSKAPTMPKEAFNIPKRPVS